MIDRVTISVWRSAAEAAELAYRQPKHCAAITGTAGWYAEELFARFTALDVRADRSRAGRTEARGRTRR